MEEKKHVGRPTNEEVASRKKKKVIKYSLITIVSILLVGGIALFLNRDNIDLSSIMGASVFKSQKYVVNDPRGYAIKLDVSKLDKSGYTKCKVSNEKYASCEVPYYSEQQVVLPGDKLLVKAKKKGNVTVTVYGKNKKGKTVSKKIRIKIGSDFTSPVCKVSLPPVGTLKIGSKIEATVTCNENVTLVNDGHRNFDSQYSCGDVNNVFQKREFVEKIEKINNKTYKFYFNIGSKEGCPNKKIVDDYKILFFSNRFKDSNGNGNKYFISEKMKLKLQ